MNPSPDELPAPLRRGRALASVAVLAGLGGLAACVPIPYRPAASVTHVGIAPDDAAATVLVIDAGQRLTRPLGKSLQHEDPRIELVDAQAFVSRLAPPRTWTVADVAAVCAPEEPPCPADYLLSVGTPDKQKLHDTGAWSPFLFVPSVVGYEKTQSREVLAATLLDLHHPEVSERLFSVSNYTEVTAGLFYGFSTIALPDSAVQHALVRDVARRLAQTQPQGVVRLVMFREESSAYLDESAERAAGDAH
jgi:hypothetical protein